MDAGMNVPELPEAFRKRVQGQLEGEYPDFIRALEKDAVRGLRLNPMKRAAGLNIPGLGAPIPWTEDGYELSLDSGAGTTAAHEAGAFYLQDPCAMIPALALDAHPGERILDLCAAPGGKSTQIGLAMRGEGLLICNEPVLSRAKTLSRNLERMGIPHGIVVCAMPEKLSARWPESFDGVMVDAPCSGEGMFGRHPETRLAWSEESAEGCAKRQTGILENAARLVRPGGRMVYATCTWNPAENEEQVASFLERHPEFSPESWSLPGLDPQQGMLTCWPHRLRGGGQFMALLRKNGSSSETVDSGAKSFPVPKPDGKAQRILQASGIRAEAPTGTLGQTLVHVPSGCPDLTGVHTLRLGLHLGQIRGDLFFPDHALAVSVLRPDVPMQPLSDGEALRYLAGEELAGSIPGWQTVSWHGLALGWAKGSGGRLKNHYPKGLRNGRLIL